MNLVALISLFNFLIMKCKSIVYKNVLCFVTMVDGVSTFQGKKTRILKHLKHKVAAHLYGIYCMVSH